MNIVFSEYANQKSYPFVLKDLPFSKNSFEPRFSLETFNYHYLKHHASYVKNLNSLLSLKGYECFLNLSLEEVIISSFNKHKYTLFNNASQVWNHSFFWSSISPIFSEPSSFMMKYINRDFVSYDIFIKTFCDIALKNFGSGWTWIVLKNNRINIINTDDAVSPIIHENIYPIAVCDVWEHAYYIDYRNNRMKYLDVFIRSMINWNFVESNFSALI